MTTRFRHRHRFIGEVLKAVFERPLAPLSLGFAAQRVGDRLRHVGLAQPGQLPGEPADLKNGEC